MKTEHNHTQKKKGAKKNITQLAQNDDYKLLHFFYAKGYTFEYTGLVIYFCRKYSAAPILRYVRKQQEEQTNKNEQIKKVKNTTAKKN